MPKLIFRCTQFLFLCLIFLAIPRPVHAEAPSPDQLIAAVNMLRSQRGLEPYSVDGGLMSYAQQHADYMASVGYATHTHSDGSQPWSAGLDENTAYGADLTTDFTVNSVWSDAIHMKTMVGYQGGSVGAGVSSKDGILYVSLDVRPSGSAMSVQPAVSASQADSAQSAQPVALRPQQIAATATPLADGSIIHTVQDGETLAGIAQLYGVTVEKIRELNSMAPTSNLIFPGEKLAIRAPLPPTATPTITPTVAKPTRTPTPVIPTHTPVPTRTPEPTLTPTATPNPIVGAVNGFVDQNQRGLLIGMIILCGAGLLWVLFKGFIRK